MLYDVEMTLTAEIGRTRLPVRQVLELAPGAVLELDRTAGSPADVMVNGRLIARGEVVVVDEAYGIRVTEIVSGHGVRRLMLTATFVLRLLLALTCVVGLIWFIGRRFGNGGPSSSATSREPAVKVVGRQSMGRHTGVAVVAVGQRRLLIGYGEQQVTMLTELGPVFDELPTPKIAGLRPARREAGPDAVGLGRPCRQERGRACCPPRATVGPARPTAITPESLAAAGVPTPGGADSTAVAAPKELDASPLDRLDQSDWPTVEDVASSAPRARSSDAAVPAVPLRPVARRPPSSSSARRLDPRARHVAPGAEVAAGPDGAPMIFFDPTAPVRARPRRSACPG